MKKILTILAVLAFSGLVEAKGIDFQTEIYPIMINNCASCHNANTPNTNWLDEKVAISNKANIYSRVFVQGDMPLFFRFFGGADKELLKKWLETPDVEM